LAALELPTALNVVEECSPYRQQEIYSVQPLTRPSTIGLVQIEQRRSFEPLLFGCLSLDQGIAMVRQRHAVYSMAVDENEQPVGAVA